MMQRGYVWRTRGALGIAMACLAAVLLPEGGEGQEADTVDIDTPYRWILRSARLGLAGGYVDAGLTNLGLGPQSTPVVGARGRFRVSSPISLEAGVLYGDSDRFVVDPRLESGPATVDTVSSRWLLAEAAMQFAVTGNRTWHGLQPYALVGGGFLVGVDEEVSSVFGSSDLADFRYDIEVMPVIQAGAGVEWLVDDRWGVGFEFRDHLWRVTTPDGFFGSEVLDRIESLDLPAPSETDWTHNLELSVTVWRYF